MLVAKHKEKSMSIKPELIGHTLAPTTFEIERGKIREFAAATGDPNPIYTNRVAAQAVGYEDTPVPPTFGTVMGFWARGTENQAAELGFPVAGVLHGEEEYTYLAPIYPGDILNGHQKVVSIAERKGKTGSMQITTLETVYTNQAGQAVLKSRTTIVIPESMNEGEGESGRSDA
jgi:acyl dehydratase